jgi:excisionase family DNA binding protein
MNLQVDEKSLEALAQRVLALIRKKDRFLPVEEGFVDVQGAADFLACPKSRIYALVSARRLPHHRDGSRLLFDPAELREYVAAGGARRP